MIPQIATVRLHHETGRRIRLWIPLLPIYVILTPLLTLMLIGVIGASIRYRVNPIRALAAFTRLLAAVRGTQVDVEHGPTAVLVKLT